MTDLYTRPMDARVRQPDGTWGPSVRVLVGASPEDCAAIAKAPSRPLKTSIKATRDGGRHRHLFVLFQTAYKNLPEGWHMSFDTFRKALMIDAGHYEEVHLPDGSMIQVPLSLEYAKMDQTQFDVVKDDIIKCLVTRWIPGLNSEAFEGEILEAIA